MMRKLHLEKKGLRCLAIAESFTQDSKKSILAGVVMRRDFVIDGFVFGKASLEGDDATETILSMFKKLNRPDISYLLISGIIISMYNIIDLTKISKSLGIPVIGVTYHESQGIDEAIKHHFPETYELKLKEYKKLEEREKIVLHTSYNVYIRKEGCTLSDVKHLLDEITIQGSFPEPLRVAQLLAKTLFLET
jgi:uncharacterized protein